MTNQTNRNMIAILASSEDNTIGANGTIPWRCRSDMLFFKRATIGNVVIMGRTTFESLGNIPLPNRFNIVISGTLNNNDFAADNLTIVPGLMRAIQLARKADLTLFDRNTVKEHIFIIGGVKLYSAAIPVVQEVIHSKIDVHCGSPRYGDTFIRFELSKYFTSKPDVTNEVIYYNPGVIVTPDKNKLIEITHSYYKTNDEPMSFKED